MNQNQNQNKTSTYDELDKILKKRTKNIETSNKSKIVGESLKIFKQGFLKNIQQK